ncbi:hypothetical protein B0T25DRAFT_345149 [Lasiosphaeria hispida]|uniref:Uncharacterized protein n=1 Tax=Lasiosphaeria hispida TaxID=260671 RepID=A0AAJ0H6H2_9PEZI|nr:hypothetical protein B0T25DRAFT_345149 [Lasiosphaeria hispida]
MSYIHLTQTLAESFNALANEVQALIDHKTILEHKLRFAHEQYQYLADKHAPAIPELSETLAKLQLPPDLQHHSQTATSAVPLPKRGQAGNAQHQIALLIREGRKAAQQLVAAMVDVSKDGGSSKETSSLSPVTENMTSTSTVLEQDFTVEGRKSSLACPFSTARPEAVGFPHSPEHGGHSQNLTSTTIDLTPHKSSDPICAAMQEETMSVPAQGASKCPIRFLDKHSPEEIAHYVETHKHEIPRSHEVCVRRYQKNEEQIRKLDAKYGNLVSMINDLSHLHQPMLPLAANADLEEVDRSSNQRVENWAQEVITSDPEQAAEAPHDDDRQSHFDRPLRDVRLGESPSRPWGISVPLAAGLQQEDVQRPESPPPAPVTMHSPLDTPQETAAPRKCPFDHTKLPFPSYAKVDETSNRGGFDREAERPCTPVKNRVPPPSPPHQQPQPQPQPTFLNPAAMASPQPEKGETSGPPQMIFNISGPVFIGYPMEQAMQFMQRFQCP